MTGSSQAELALVTGASSGIGEAYARYLGQRNDYVLLLVARRAELLQRLKNEIDQTRSERFGDAALPVDMMVVDLLDEQAQTSLITHLGAGDRRIGMLVNCAGFATLGRFYESELEREEAVLDINCLVPMRLIAAALPTMIEHGQGTIINISSIGAFQPAPYMAVYAASKSFMLNYSLAIAQELRDTGVRVFTHCPGPTQTEFHLVAGLPADMSPMPPMSATATVAEAMSAMQRNKGYWVNGRINRWLLRLGRLLSPVRAARMAERVLLSRWTP